MKIDSTTLKSHPFFEDMSGPHLEVLARLAKPKHYAAGQLIFREGDVADRFFLINEGAIAIQTHSAGRPVKVQVLEAGDVLGWSWLFPPFHWHFDATAKEATDGFYFDAKQLREECEADTALGYELMRRLAEIVVDRLQAARLKLAHAAKGRQLELVS